MNVATKAIATAATGCVVLAALVGCSGDEPQSDAKKTTVTKPFVADGKLPKGFPKAEVPTPEGKVQSARDSVGPDNAKGWSVVFEVPGKVESADKKFATSLVANKFEVDTKPTAIKGRSIQRQYENGKYTVMMKTSAVGDTKSLISLQVLPIAG